MKNPRVYQNNKLSNNNNNNNNTNNNIYARPNTQRYPIDYAVTKSGTYILATIISKLFESVLLLKCEDYLSTCSNQFGFKKGHSTDLCIYALKEYIEYYKNRNTSVFVTMLDASKAFDRVNFWLLFQKLLSRNVPLFIVRILAMSIHIK